MPQDNREPFGKMYQSAEDGGTVFIPARPRAGLGDQARILRVCAYCRVSTDNDEQLSSFELQQAHYKQLVRDKPNWDLKHIYADAGISGTSLKNRDAFNAMIAACENGEYDLIVTKQVSRFARNLVDCISLIRKLKNLEPPVGVLFETDNLNTLDKDSEFILAFLASFAQEESIKKREAMIWSLAQRFKDRRLLTPPLLGYDRQRDAAGSYIKYAPLIVNEAEARVVRFIFDAYLYGWTQADIAAFLTGIDCRTKTGSTKWNSSSIGYILSNERYCGDVLTWKTFTSDLFEHRRKKNRQDMDQYCYKGQHEAIIPREKFEMVQALLQNRKHHIRGAFPCLHVIDGGVFRGFVPINHHWINEDPRLYYDSSNSVDQKAGKMRFAKSSFSAFDLKGYQVVRNQFTQARYEGPAVTISNNRITFNLFCMRKFADAGYAQLLLHPSERKLAIRSAISLYRSLIVDLRIPVMAARAETQLYHIEKPGGPLDICKAPHIGLGHIVKELLPRGKQPVKFPLQLPTVVLYTTKQVHQIAVDIVIDLQLARLFFLGEKHPGRAAEYLNIPLHFVRGEAL